MTDSLLADKRFWINAIERSVLTFAQSLVAELAVFEVADIEEMKLDGLPWYAMISVAVVAALISLLTTIGKGSSGSAGSGVDLQAERVDEAFAHDDIPGVVEEEQEEQQQREEEREPSVAEEAVEEEARTEEKKAPSKEAKNKKKK